MSSLGKGHSFGSNPPVKMGIEELTKSLVADLRYLLLLLLSDVCEVFPSAKDYFKKCKS